MALVRAVLSRHGKADQRASWNRLLSWLSGGFAVLVLGTVRAGPADFDASFGQGGLARLDASAFLAPYAAAVDPQGRILLIGTTGGSGNIAIGRLTPAGQIDTAFGNGGRRVMPEQFHGYQNPTRFSVRFDARGRAVLAASVLGPSRGNQTPDNRAAVYRLNTDGVPDPGFGNGGTVIFQGPDTGFVFRDIALDRQDRVLLAGKSYSAAAGSAEGADLFRLTEAGQPDPTFGEQGGISLARLGFPSSGGATAIAVDAQGRMVIALAEHAPLRLLPDGTMDTGFSNEASRTVPADFRTRSVTSLIIQADGRLVFMTRSSAGPGLPGKLHAARLNAGGTYDTTFGTGGQLVSPSLAVSAAMGSAADASGRLLHVGSTYGNSLFSGDAFVSRFSAEGQPDASFGNDGVWRADYLDSDDAYAALVDRSGRILVLGGVYEAYQPSWSFVIRLRGEADAAGPDSSPDPFVIRNRDSVPLQSRVAFGAVAVAGINQPASVSVQGGEFCISTTSACGCDVLASGTRKASVSAGLFVCPFHQSATTGNTAVTSTLDIGGFAAPFTSVTAGVAVLPPPAYNIGSNTWWNPGKSGWGVVLSQRGSLVLGGLYVYGDSRLPVWYSFYCTMTAETCDAELLLTSGPPLAQTFDPARVTRTVAGTLKLRFANRDNVALDIALPGFTTTLSAARQTLLPFPAIGTDLSDLWWNPAESGWGVNITHSGQTLFLVWYGYDYLGRPLWLTSICTWYANECAGKLEETTGPPLRLPYDATQVTRREAGQMTLRPADNGALRFDFTYGGLPYSKIIKRL